MTEENFVRGMAILQEAFPNRSINTKLYFSALEDLSDKSFEDAVLAIVRTTTKLFPDDNLIAMIREHINGKLEDHAVLAWDTAIKTAQKYDYYYTVCFEDRIVNGVIRAMGGWEAFSSMLIENQPFERKRFIELYAAYSRSGRDCPEKLEGNFERKNLRVEKVTLISADYLQHDRKRLQS